MATFVGNNAGGGGGGAGSTSLRVFRSFLYTNADGTINASNIHSPQCYAAWLNARGTEGSDEEAKRFQRALTNHVSGVVRLM